MRPHPAGRWVLYQEIQAVEEKLASQEDLAREFGWDGEEDLVAFFRRGEEARMEAEADRDLWKKFAAHAILTQVVLPAARIDLQEQQELADLRALVALQEQTLAEARATIETQRELTAYDCQRASHVAGKLAEAEKKLVTREAALQGQAGEYKRLLARFLAQEKRLNLLQARLAEMADLVREAQEI